MKRHIIPCILSLTLLLTACGAPAEEEAVKETSFFCVLPHGFAAHFHGELSIKTIAGVGESAVDIHVPMGAGAGNGLAADFCTAGTSIGAAFVIV